MSQHSVGPMSSHEGSVPSKFLFQPPPGKLNMSAMDVRDMRNMHNDPMAQLTNNFNNSMNVGKPSFKQPMGGAYPPGMNYNNQNMAGLSNSPPGMNPADSKLNQTQPYFYPMDSQIDVSPYPPQKLTQPPPPAQPPQPDVKPPEKPANKEGSSKLKTSLKAGSRSFKPASKKTESNSFYQPPSQPQLKAHQSYMNASLPGTEGFIQQNKPTPSMPFQLDFPPPPQNMNSTFNGVLPGMLPPPPNSGYSQHIPPASGLNSIYHKPPSSGGNISGSQLTGRVKYFKPEHNYGFIVSDKDGENIFFHYSELKSQSISKDALAQAKDKYIIRLVFQVVKYVGKYKLSQKAVNIFVTEFSEVNKNGVQMQAPMLGTGM